jgi:hypothetical protein
MATMEAHSELDDILETMAIWLLPSWKRSRTLSRGSSKAIAGTLLSGIDLRGVASLFPWSAAEALRGLENHLRDLVVHTAKESDRK